MLFGDVVVRKGACQHSPTLFNVHGELMEGAAVGGVQLGQEGGRRIGVVDRGVMLDELRIRVCEGEVQELVVLFGGRLGGQLGKAGEHAVRMRGELHVDKGLGIGEGAMRRVLHKGEQLRMAEDGGGRKEPVPGGGRDERRGRTARRAGLTHGEATRDGRRGGRSRATDAALK